MSRGMVVALFLHACANRQPLSPERRLQIACSSYVETVDALAIRNRLGLLSGEAQARVDDAVTVIAPVCEGDIEADPRTVLVAVETALIVMLEERETVDAD